MRITIRIDDDLYRELKKQTHSEGTSLGKLVNRLLRRGMVASRQMGKPSRPYRQKTYPLGPPKVNLDKALALAAAMEDEETIRKLAQAR